MKIYADFEVASEAFEAAPYCAYAALCAARLAPNQAIRARMTAFVEINRTPLPPAIPETESAEHALDEESSGISGVTSDAITADDKNPVPTPPESGLTESFIQILIKNQNYRKALAIIQDLNLKNPEKSIYFADQIRFLKKLIINQAKSSTPDR